MTQKSNYPYVKRNIKKLKEAGNMCIFGWLSAEEYEKLKLIKESKQIPTIIETLRILIRKTKV
jgi:hypothetical protein